jgi:hypothetical protein
MPDTLTANYGLTKPEINGSPNTWGNKLNDDMDVIDTNLKRVDDLATGAVSRAGSGTDPDDYIMEVLRYAETVSPANDLDLITVKLVKAWITNASPIGSIVAWGGTIASIPTCWALCDGSTVNGNLTPNLVDKFILGAGGAITPGNFGGAKTHDHGGVVGGTAISVSQMPSHNHGVNDPSHSHSVNDPSHAHTQYVRSTQDNYGGGPSSSASASLTTTATLYAYTGISIAYAYTGISIAANGGGAAHNHTIAAANHVPPYYALAYLMRVKFPWDA